MATTPNKTRINQKHRKQISVESLQQGSAIEVPSTPHMEEEGRKLLSRQLKHAKVFLEYGSGGSSVMAFSSKVEKIYSVESDAPFLDAVTQKLSRLKGNIHRYVPIHVDIGPTGSWGAPTDFASAHLWPAYANAPWITLASAKTKPDLILIDGRFRVASFFISALLAPAGCIILFDDYFDRPKYHAVEKYIPVASKAGRMAKFVVPARRPKGMIQELLNYCTKFD